MTTISICDVVRIAKVYLLAILNTLSFKYTFHKHTEIPL